MKNTICKNLLAAAIAVIAMVMTSGAQAWAQSTEEFVTGHGTAGAPYQIKKVENWNYLCEKLQSDYDNYKDKYYKLNVSITVTQMAGGDVDHPFIGHFDGNGNTITVNYGSAESPLNYRYAAPFKYVGGGAIISGLVVAGDIYTSSMYAGGIVGYHKDGNVTIENCRSSVNIHCSQNADGSRHGGLVGTQNAGSLTITGCVFNGKMLATGTVNDCGGFIGGRGAGLTTIISDSFFTPTELSSGIICATFFTGAADGDITNSYGTQLVGTNQGKLARSVNAGTNITVDGYDASPVGYSASGITSYGTGLTGCIKYNGVVYAGNGDFIKITLDNAPAMGYIFDRYTASWGTLTDEGSYFTLAMIDKDVVIDGVFRSINYIDATGTIHNTVTEGKTLTVLTGGGATSLDAGWYVVKSNIDYTGTVTLNGDVTIILCNGYTMNIGTETSPFANGVPCMRGEYDLTIYGQTLDENTAGQFIAYGENNYATILGVKNYTQHSGNVKVVNTGTGLPIGIEAGIVTINGGKLYSNAGARSIGASGIIINGGKVSIVGSIYAYNNGTTTLGWTNADDYINAWSFTGYAVTLSKDFVSDSGVKYNAGSTYHSDPPFQYKTLRPYIPSFTLTATSATVLGEAKYVTTFYNSSSAYQLPEGAMAYTAGLDGGALVLYRIGTDSRVIPAGTAVIIISNTGSIELTKLDSTSVTAKAGNVLRGSDTAVVKTDNIRVLGIENGVLKFYKLSADTVPAGKAYYLAQ